MNCQAVRPEREPRVIARSSASRSTSGRGWTKMLGIADNHRKIVFLRTAMKPKPQPETVGERFFPEPHRPDGSRSHAHFRSFRAQGCGAGSKLHKRAHLRGAPRSRLRAQL